MHRAYSHRVREDVIFKIIQSMSSQFQYIFDNRGNKTGVFLSIDDSRKFLGLSLDEPVAQWELELIKGRMQEHRANPDAGTSWEIFRQQMVDEDGPL